MTWLLNIVGVLLVLTALRDIFHTLWHPRGFGTLARLVFRLVWTVLSKGRSTELAGPLGLVLTVAAWAALVVAGWTLVYLPHMPEGFNFGSSLQPLQSNDLVASVYLSLVAVATLGFGDIIPAYDALRLTVPLQALIGFVLFTAAISWILQVYPALTRRRSLAKRLSIMAATDSALFVTTGSPSVVAQLLQSLVEELLTIASDLVQYGESYYFREEDRAQSLAAHLHYALDLAAAGEQSDSVDVRHLSTMLREAVESTAAVLEEYVGGGDSVPAILDAFSEDHGHDPVRA